MEHKTIVLTEKIPIGISLCAMGGPVRYNGKGIDVLTPLGREKNDFIFCPVCPECQAGLGVTRDPVHLSGGDRGGCLDRGSRSQEPWGTLGHQGDERGLARMP